MGSDVDKHRTALSIRVFLLITALSLFLVSLPSSMRARAYPTTSTTAERLCITSIFFSVEVVKINTCVASPARKEQNHSRGPAESEAVKHVLGVAAVRMPAAKFGTIRDTLACSGVKLGISRHVVFVIAQQSTHVPKRRVGSRKSVAAVTGNKTVKQ